MGETGVLGSDSTIDRGRLDEFFLWRKSNEKLRADTGDGGVTAEVRSLEKNFLGLDFLKTGMEMELGEEMTSSWFDDEE